MAIPIILKGDTAAAIPFTAPDAVVELLAVYQGVTRRFANVASGASLSIAFTAEETAKFELGTFPLVFAAKFADGRVKTYPFTAKVKVTDSPGLVYLAEVVIPGEEPAPLDGVDEIPARHTADDTAAKVNEIIRKLGGGTAATALALCLSAFGAGVQTAPLGTIYNDAPVVTNVTFDGLAPTDYETVSNRAMSAVQPGEMAAAIAAISRPDLTAATNYTDAATNNLRAKADLAYRNEIHNGIEKWTVQIQGVDAPQTAEWNDDFQQWYNQEPPVNGLGIKIAASGYILATTGGDFPFTLSGGSATVSDGWFTYTLTPVAFAEDRLALVSEVPAVPAGVVTTNNNGEIGANLSLAGGLSVAGGITTGGIMVYGSASVDGGDFVVGGVNIIDALATKATTNEVKSIVTETTVTGYTDWTFSGDTVPGVLCSIRDEEPTNPGSYIFTLLTNGIDAASVESSIFKPLTLTFTVGSGSITASREPITVNKLGLARLTDLADFVTHTELTTTLANMDTSYTRTIGLTNKNQSVQYVAMPRAQTELNIVLPTDGATKDWLVYVLPANDVTLKLPLATYWATDAKVLDAMPSNTVTALYFSQVTDGVYSIGRQTLQTIDISNNTAPTEGN